jgi:hypothetical protein
LDSIKFGRVINFETVAESLQVSTGETKRSKIARIKDKIKNMFVSRKE